MEVTVGSEDLIAALSTNKKLQDHSPILEKDKRKGVLSGEAYSRAVDRYASWYLKMNFLHLLFNLNISD